MSHASPLTNAKHLVFSTLAYIYICRDADEELEIIQMKMEACGGHVEDLCSPRPTYKEEEEEENPNARQQTFLWEMAQVANYFNDIVFK